jgi:WD40 repeat protein
MGRGVPPTATEARPEVPEALAEGTRGFTGRGWVFEALDRWLSEDRQRRFLLVGGPGTGKSTLAARLVELGRGEVPADGFPRLGQGALAAAHFCRARVDQTLDPRRVFESLSLQLASRYPGFRDALIAQAKEPGVEIHISGRAEVEVAEGEVSGIRIGSLDVAGLAAGEVFDRLLRRPLEALCTNDFEGQVLILVDALDEALGYQGHPNLVEALRAATDASEELPAQVRLLFTSRPDRRATERMGELAMDLLADAPPDEHDVRDYAERRLATKLPDAEERRAVAARVAEAGNGNFLYARYVVEDLLARPEALSDLGTLTLPDGLEEHYREFLSRELARSDEPWAERYRPLLGALAVAHGDGLTAAELAGATELRRSQADYALRVLAPYLSPPSMGGRVRLYHQSFRDFLLHDRDYGVYPDEANQRLADFFLDEYGEDWSADEPSGGSRDYALEHTPTHLAEAAGLAGQRSTQRRLAEQLASLLLDLEFLEAKTSALGVDAAVADLRLAADAIGNPEVGTLERVLDRAAHVLRGWSANLRPELFDQELANAARAIAAAPIEQAALSRIRNGGRPVLLFAWRSQEAGSELLRTLRGHDHDVVGVDMSADGTLAVSVDEHGTLVAWNATSGEATRIVDCRARAEDVCLLADGRAAVACSDGVRLVDLQGGMVSDVLKHNGRVNAVAAHNRYRRLFFGCSDGSLHVWDSAGMRQVVVHSSIGLEVHAVAVAEDASTVVTAAGRELRLWDAETGDQRGVLGAHESFAAALTIARDGHTALSGHYDGKAHLWDVRHRRLTRSFDFGGEWVRGVAFASEPTALVALDNGTLTVLDLTDGAARSFGGHELAPRDLVTSADGALGLSGSDDRTLLLWDVAAAGRTPFRRGHGVEVTHLAISADDRLVVSCAQDSSVKAWDRANGGLLWTSKADSMITGVTLLPDETVLLARVGGVVDRVVMERRSAASGRCLDEWTTDLGGLEHLMPGFALLCSSDRVARLVHSEDHRVCTEVKIPGSRGWPKVATTPTGDRVVAEESGQLWCWDTAGKLVAELDGSHSDRVLDIAMSADGRAALLARRSGAVDVWRIESGDVNTLYAGPRRPESTYAVDEVRRDALRVVASASVAVCVYNDGWLRVWDVTSGALVASALVSASPSAVAVSPSGNVVVGDDWGNVHCASVVWP